MLWICGLNPGWCGRVASQTIVPAAGGGGGGAMNGENAVLTLSVEGALVFLLQLRQNRSKRQSLQLSSAGFGSLSTWRPLD